MSLEDCNVNFGRRVLNEDLDIAVVPCCCTTYVFRVFLSSDTTYIDLILSAYTTFIDLVLSSYTTYIDLVLSFYMTYVDPILSSCTTFIDHNFKDKG